MLGLSHFPLTTAAVVVLLTCVLSFNVDQKNGLSFSGPVEDMFGYTIQQFENSEGKWVLIGSPLSGQPAKRTGDVYKCPVGRGDNTCVKLELPKNTTVPNLHEVKENMTMGTTLVTNPNGGFLGVTGGWSLSQIILGKKRGTPWTGHQTIAGLTYRDGRPFTLTFTPTNNLDSPVNLHVFGLWEEAGVPEKSHTDTGRTCKLHTEGP